ncbi:MAG: methyltransferase domain-containing protein [Planctomycetales bacterium]|nr:methyltransferase domain-containing protein [Planctomycetales bacterium]
MNLGWHRLATRRADLLAKRISPHLPRAGRVLDVGSGTGHNAAALRAMTNLEFAEADVVDMHTVGNGPALFDGHRLPFGDGEFAASLLLFVLHYPDDPLQLMREAGRVTAGRVLVLQSTYRGGVGLALLKFREFWLGRFAFRLARITRFIGRVPCPLRPRRFWTREELIELGRRAQLTLREVVIETSPGHFSGHRFLSRDLFVWESSPVP